MLASAHKHSFPRNFRLRTSRDFQKIYKNPKKFSGRHFTLLSSENAYSYPRLGVVITKKKVKLAVDRNRLKRLVKESFRVRHQELKQAVDIVVIVHRDTQLVAKQQLQHELEKQWQKLIVYYQNRLS